MPDIKKQRNIPWPLIKTILFMIFALVSIVLIWTGCNENIGSIIVPTTFIIVCMVKSLELLKEPKPPKRLPNLKTPQYDDDDDDDEYSHLV